MYICQLLYVAYAKNYALYVTNNSRIICNQWPTYIKINKLFKLNYEQLLMLKYAALQTISIKVTLFHYRVTALTLIFCLVGCFFFLFYLLATTAFVEMLYYWSCILTIDTVLLIHKNNAELTEWLYAFNFIYLLSPHM